MCLTSIIYRADSAPPSEQSPVALKVSDILETYYKLQKSPCVSHQSTAQMIGRNSKGERAPRDIEFAV